MFLELLLAASFLLSSTGPSYGQRIGSCRPPVEKILRVSVLLPTQQTKSDPHDLVYHNQLEAVVPAVELVGIPWGGEENSTTASLLGERSPRFHEILPGWTLEVTPGDTQCSSTHGPLMAFDLHCQAGRIFKPSATQKSK